MRRNVVAGNWKMNNSFDQAEELLSAIADELDKIETAPAPSHSLAAIPTKSITSVSVKTAAVKISGIVKNS